MHVFRRSIVDDTLARAMAPMSGQAVTDARGVGFSLSRIRHNPGGVFARLRSFAYGILRRNLEWACQLRALNSPGLVPKPPPDRGRGGGSSSL